LNLIEPGKDKSVGAGMKNKMSQGAINKNMELLAKDEYSNQEDLRY